MLRDDVLLLLAEAEGYLSGEEMREKLVFPTPRHDKGLILFRGNRSRLTGFDGQGVVFVIQSDVRILLWREVPFIFQIYRFSGCKNQKCPG